MTFVRHALAALAFSGLSFTLCAQEAPPSSGVKEQAATAALADGASTLGVLAAGGIETNPIMPSSPIGILVMTAAKMGLADYADKLPEQQRREMLRNMNAGFGGAAVNNLMVLLAGSNPVALVAGLVAGGYFWVDTDKRLTEEAEAKATYYRALAQKHHREVMAIYNSTFVEAYAVKSGEADGEQLAALEQQPINGRFYTAERGLVAPVEAGEPTAGAAAAAAAAATSVVQPLVAPVVAPVVASLPLI